MQEEMTRLRMAAAGEDGMLITGEARRDAAWFLPPGYAARPEPGSTVLTADLGGGPLALGVPMAQADLLPGEIRLTARCCHAAALSRWAGVSQRRGDHPRRHR